MYVKLNRCYFKLIVSGGAGRVSCTYSLVTTFLVCSLFVLVVALLFVMQLYTVSRDGALVVWESSMSLAEMRDYQETVGAGSGKDHISKASVQEKLVSLPEEEDDDGDASEGESGTEGEMGASEAEEEEGDECSELVSSQ